MNDSDFEGKKVWAVVGSVHNKDKFAYKIFKFLTDKGYRVYPVDPSGNPVDGGKTYVSLKDIPEMPEAVNIVINPVKGRIFLDEAIGMGIRYIWFQPGAESVELIESARAHDMEVIYNKCVMIEFK